MNAIQVQLQRVQDRYPAAHLAVTPEGQQLLVVPEVPAGDGWTRERVTIRIMVPNGFPHVKLDCFYADGDLRLASGAEPGSSSCQSVFGENLRWFSWHVATWDPNRDGLDQYLRFCERRLREAR